ncbi:hypothetical protein Droror1_Dr00017618, partial [Drosera rotundifolia]
MNSNKTAFPAFDQVLGTVNFLGVVVIVGFGGGGSHWRTRLAACKGNGSWCLSERKSECERRRIDFDGISLCKAELSLLNQLSRRIRKLPKRRKMGRLIWGFGLVRFDWAYWWAGPAKGRRLTQERPIKEADLRQFGQKGVDPDLWLVDLALPGFLIIDDAHDSYEVEREGFERGELEGYGGIELDDVKADELDVIEGDALDDVREIHSMVSMNQ